MNTFCMRFTTTPIGIAVSIEDPNDPDLSWTDERIADADHDVKGTLGCDFGTEANTLEIVPQPEGPPIRLYRPVL